MAALIGLYATLGAVAPFVAVWHAARPNGRPARPWRAGRPIPAHALISRHR